MTTFSRDAVAKLAQRIVNNPMSATISDARLLAKAWLMLTQGKR